MKSILKSVGRRFWRLGAPLRRPVARRVAAHVSESVSVALREQMNPRLDHAVLAISHARTEVGTYRNETNLLLDSLVRELSRLQDQVEILQQLVAESVDSGARLAAVEVSDERSTAA